MLSVTIRICGSGSYDISQLVTAISYEDNINKSGIVTFNMLSSKDVSPAEGSQILLSYAGNVYFCGYIFRIEASQKAESKITAYDQLRYFKASETYVFSGITASEAVMQICNDFMVTYGEIQNTGYKLPELVFDNQNVLDITSDCLTATIRSTGEMYYIKDVAGEVVLRNIKSAVSDIIIDPQWLLYGYSYERSIDDDTYNQIKLLRDNKETGERELFVAKDSSTIAKWGLLQYSEKVDDGMNEEQIKAMADGYLQLKNKPTRKLSVECIGHKNIRAGNVICVSIPQQGIYDFLLCTSASHTFKSTGHTVKAEFKLV